MMELLAKGASTLGIALSKEQLQQFETYYSALSRANVNVTSVRDYEGVQQRHFLESLAVLAALRQRGLIPEDARRSLLDVGSGGGFPGLPMKIAAPELRLTLLEATTRKAAFLSSTIAELRLADAAVICERAETAAHDPSQRESYEVVTARAVAALPALVELTLPFLKIGGYLAAMKGSEAESEVALAGRALELCGGRVVETVALRGRGAPVPTLVLVEKVASTPDAYPRRPGIPTKRPLL